ncbi:MAG: Dual-specificity RNA pseudouridine synthase RluA [Chlamydiia bacterium]|nr:Dual-specificity RNA pseudouridine synthase RluA [Chlamydiia bacterium]
MWPAQQPWWFMKPSDSEVNLKILYEDNHLLALIKPHGLLTQPTDQCADSLETRAKQMIKERDQKPGNVFLHPIHRLDRIVGGIVLFAKTSKALSRLQAAMRSGAIDRIYHARVTTPPKKKEGRLIDTLEHAHQRAKVSPNGKRSELIYRHLKENLLEIELITGRYHQIRAQLAHHGMPIIGDTKYGGPKATHAALTHVKMRFDHPVESRKVVLELERELR